MISPQPKSFYPPSSQVLSLPGNFFTDLLQSQQTYNNIRDKQTMSVLLAKYTDLVAYFQAKREPATEYFQAKIKALISNVKFFTHSPADLEVNRAKLNKDMCNVMETEMDKVHKDMKINLEKQKRINRKVNQIIADQTSKLDERIRNSRRSCMKGNSRKNTLSFATLESTPTEQKDRGFIDSTRRHTDRITSSCISEKHRIDEDIQRYFEEGAIIATNFSDDESENEQMKERGRRQRYKLKKRL